MKTCPNCNGPANALIAIPHCKSKTCTWNTCRCGARYDRDGENYFLGQKQP